jgi:hypothetical protein
MRLYIKVIQDRDWFMHALTLENGSKLVYLDYIETYTLDPMDVPLSLVELGNQVAKVLDIEF